MKKNKELPTYSELTEEQRFDLEQKAWDEELRKKKEMALIDDMTFNHSTGFNEIGEKPTD